MNEEHERERERERQHEQSWYEDFPTYPKARQQMGRKNDEIYKYINI
jgi:hypothetical protein